MGGLCVGLYTFYMEAVKPAILPRFLGPALRGGLGHTLRRMVCVTRLPDCDGCLLRFHCAYPTIFQPYALPDRSQGGRYARMPVPFVLRIPWGERAVEPGEVVDLGLVLLGEANQYLPYYLLAIRELGRRGIGRQRIRFRLSHVNASSTTGPVTLYRDGEETVRTDITPLRLSDLIYAASIPDARVVTVRFVTPVRIDLGDDLVYPVDFGYLIRGIAERWRALEACYGNGSILEVPEADQVVRAEDSTRWVEFCRYSTRQRTRMKLGGAVGQVTYQGPDMAAFSHLLAAGEWLGVGKLTSMGFGRLEVVRR